MKLRGRHIAGLASAAALAGVLITGFESPGGLAVLFSYPDPVTHGAPWTACDGETKGIKPNMVFTPAQCDAMTGAQIRQTDAAVVACTRPGLPIEVQAAFDSLAWNIGIGGFCQSSIAAFAKQNRLTDACDRIALYNRAGGKVIPGLTFRRGQEQQICLSGVPK